MSEPRRPHQHFNWQDANWQEVPGVGGAFAAFDLDGSEGGTSAAVLVRYAAHSVFPAHRHPTDYCSVVLDGEMRIGQRRIGVGDVRVVRRGVRYGPLEIGPGGCVVIDFFADRAGARSEFDDPSVVLSVEF